MTTSEAPQKFHDFGGTPLDRMQELPGTTDTFDQAWNLGHRGWSIRCLGGSKLMWNAVGAIFALSPGAAVASTAVTAQNSGTELDAKVQSFLERHRGTWRDLNGNFRQTGVQAAASHEIVRPWRLSGSVNRFQNDLDALDTILFFRPGGRSRCPGRRTTPGT